MKLTIFIIIFLSYLDAYALTQSQCPNIDYRERFTAKRDQTGNGLCWAFAGSALIEEQRCIEDQSTCGKEQVSVIDGHRCFWNKKQGLGTEKTGALATGFFSECVVNNGVCLEQHAPFVRTDDFVSQDHYNATVVRALQATLLLKIRNNVSVKEGCVVGESKDVNQFTEDFGKIVAKLLKDMADDYDHLKIDYQKALLTSGHYTEALREVFISQDCKENRVYLKDKNVKPRFKFIEFKPNQEKHSMLLEKLKSGRSASIGLCGRRARQGRYDDLFFMAKWVQTKEEFNQAVKKSKCGDHAVVINGMRFKDGRCQVHVRNSWYKGSGLEGWEDAENILEHTKTLEYLENYTTN